MSSIHRTRLGAGALSWPDEPDSTVELLAIGRSEFLQEVRRREPGILANLADLAGLDDAGHFGAAPIFRVALEEWGKRWNLSDEWCLDVADATVKTWQGPTGELFRAPSAASRFQGPSRTTVLAALDWLYPMFVASKPNPLSDEEESIPPLDPFFLSWNPLLEEWKYAESRMLAAFQKHLRTHRDRIQSLVYAGEPVRPGSKPERHFRWLAMYQVQRLPSGERYSYRTLAEVEGVAMQSIEQALNETAELIGLTLRKGKGGRPRKATSRTVRPVIVR